MMKFVVRWAFRFLVLSIVLVVALLLLKDTILKSVIENRIRAETGMDAKIGRLSVSLGTPTVSLEHVKLYNTADFGGSLFASVPDVYAEYDFAKLRAGVLQFKLLRLHIEELNLIETANGRTNTAAILRKLPGSSTTAPVRNELRVAGVDTLNLTLGKVRRYNLKRGGPPQEIDWQLRQQIVRNVRSFDDIQALLLEISLRRGITIYDDGAFEIGKPRPRSAPAPRGAATSPPPRSR